MKTLALTALFVFALGAKADTVAMGVGAIDSNEIVARVDGAEKAFPLEGVPAGEAKAKQFAQCLVAGRALHIKPEGKNSFTVTLMDGTNVSEQIAEFLQSRTSVDPCELGKAAYRPKG